jgi:hypothetical protein
MKRLKSYIQHYTKQTVVPEEILTRMVKNGLGRPKNDSMPVILVILYCLIKILLTKTELFCTRMRLRIKRKKIHFN